MLVEHGLGMLTNTSIGRDLEAQTSLKRGALNLRHARDAFARAARKVAELRPADMVPGDPGPDGRRRPSATYPSSTDATRRGAFEPRM